MIIVKILIYLSLLLNLQSFVYFFIEDSTYLPNEKERQEYVLNQHGIIWRGVQSVMRPSPWMYGQFEDFVLECSCLVLSYVGHLNPADRNDPIKVTRHIAAIVNSHDDKGIVEGNWTTDYSGGRAPTSWIGSASILQQFFRTRRPVRYGQCWTFAGVAATGELKRQKVFLDSSTDLHTFS